MKRLVSAVVVCGALLASQVEAEMHIIKAGKLIDPVAAQVKRDQYIVVEDGVIKSVSATKPDGEVDIDLGDKTVLPGLMDSHVHLTSKHDVHGYRRLQRTVPATAISGVVNAEKTLLAGFTTVRNLGAPGYADVALRDAINAGEVPGPRMLVSGPSIGITGGHCDSNLLPFEYHQKAEGVADGPWAVRQKVRQNVKYGVDVIKYCGTGGVLSKGTKIGAQQYTLEEMSALVDEAHLLGLKVAVHAHGTEGIKTAIKAGVDSVEHSSLIDDEGIAMAIKAGTVLSMDIYVSDFILSEGKAAGILEESLAKERIVGRKQRERFKAAYQAGAKIAFGTDAGVYAHGLNGRQFAYMVEWGMTPMQAIATATSTTAELFNIDDQTGRIAPGLAADIIAVDGDPLKDIRLLESVNFVMKNGLVYKNQ